MKKIGLIKRVWGLSKPFHRHLTLVLILLVFQNTLSTCFPIIYGKMISAVNDKDTRTVVVMLGLWLGIGLFRTASVLFRERYEVHNIDFDLPRHLAKVSMEKFFSLSMGQHQLGHSAIKQSVINKGQAAVGSLVNMAIYEIVPLASAICIPLVLLFLTAWPVGLAVLIVVAGFSIYTLRYNKGFIPRFRKIDKVGNLSGKKCYEVMANSNVVYTNAQEERMCRECDVAVENQAVIGKPAWLSYVTWFQGGQWLITSAQVCCLGLSTYLALTGKLSAGMFVTVSMWVNGSLGTLNNISHIQRNLARSYAPLLKYFGFLDFEPDIKVPQNPVQLVQPKGKIEFRDVHFHYNAREDSDIFEDDEDDTDGSKTKKASSDEKKPSVAALCGVSFVLESGKRYAMVGESGAGKSTIVSLLLRTYDPNSGSVLIDGHDLREVNYREWRRHIGLVPQDVSLFDGTLRYNVLFGINGTADDVSEQELTKTAEMSGIAGFWSTLEKGWDTVIGERGIKLSGGQRQRVGIARALIKKPAVLVFDEATSSLDTANETLIRESIQQVSRGKTTIIIAHRLATVKDADEILVFHGGRIVGQGKHQDLLRDNEHYQHLVQNQVVLS